MNLKKKGANEMTGMPEVEQEFKNLIPPLMKDEREQLEQNIVSCGKCRNAIILWEGKIIDGHNRFEICMKHGIEFEVVEMNFPSREDVKVWILENQLGRRNLNDATRIELALTKKDLLREKAKKNQILGGVEKSRAGKLLAKTSNPKKETIDVRKILAKEAGVGDRTLHRYMQVKKEGNPELVEKVKSGEIKIGTAHKMLGKEIIKQLKEASKLYKEIAKQIPYKNNDEANADIYKKLENLRELLCEFMEKIERTKHHANKTEN
jgi:hypothetical protein